MNEKALNVLSLFDGVGSAYLALKRAGLKINNYYSSEIDPSALAVLNYHYSGDSKFHQIGDIRNVDGRNYLNVDLVVFGSPCTQLSSVNSTDRSGLEGSDSKLFYEAMRILNELFMFQSATKHLYFLMENVASMTNEDRDRITDELRFVFLDSVKLFKINSSLVSGANRRRYYWTNIPNAKIPKEKNVMYQDLLVNGFVDRPKANVILSSQLTLTNGIFRYYNRNIGNLIFKDENFVKLSIEDKLLLYPNILKESCYVGKAKQLDDEYAFPNGAYRLPSVLELERLMTFPDGYISNVPNISKTQKKKLIGLSFTVDIVKELLRPLGKVDEYLIKQFRKNCS
jgi:DNA (cytosine-5)-methyltransferase 3A